MKKTKSLALTLAALIAAGLALAPSDAHAQFDTRRGDARDGDRRSRDQDRRGRDPRDLVYDAERQSNAFRDWFEHNYKKRRLGRDHDNRWLKGEIQGLDETMERLRARVNDRDRSRDLVQDAMEHARRIDRELILDNDRDTRFSVREWVDLRITLDGLARAYGVRRF